MANYCGECTYLKVNGDTEDGKFWCEYKCEWMPANALECYHYCKAYSRDSYVSRSAIEYSNNSQNSSSGCFITTALCNILSMDDNNEYLETLRKFRKEYLQENDPLILVKYDVVGPKISKMLSNDSGKFNMAYTLFNNYIVPTVQSIKNGDNYMAIAIYTEMTSKLIEYYGIDDTINVYIDDIDISKSGHGKLVKKMIEA